jgi:hypothetical protein
MPHDARQEIARGIGETRERHSERKKRDERTSHREEGETRELHIERKRRDERTTHREEEERTTQREEEESQENYTARGRVIGATHFNSLPEPLLENGFWQWRVIETSLGSNGLKRVNGVHCLHRATVVRLLLDVKVDECLQQLTHSTAGEHRVHVCVCERCVCVCVYVCVCTSCACVVRVCERVPVG